MGKGQLTKEHIIRESAGLFNTKGYAGTSLSEIIERCGIRKGGIYNHFESKDEIALAAFDYSVSLIIDLLSQAIENAHSAKERLYSICDVYIKLIENKTLEGGCPILNTAVESDDGHPLLKEHSQKAMKLLMNKLTMIINDGIKKNEFNDNINPEEVSSYIIAVVEGGMMLSKLLDDSKYIRYSAKNIMDYIENHMLV